jgi:hypothetical protein
MIRIRHVTLPAGLSAVVRRDSKGGIQVFVSDALAADRQRTAVRLALRSIDRPVWRAGLLPLPVGFLLGTFRRSIMPITRAVRSHAIASSAAAFLLAAGAAALIVALPQHHGPTVAGHAPHSGQVHAPAVGRTHIAGKRSPSHAALPTPRATVVAGRFASTPPARITATPAPPSPSYSAPAKPSKSAGPLPSSTPSPSPTAASPSPSPPPSPPSSGGVICVVLLGVWVCV